MTIEELVKVFDSVLNVNGNHPVTAETDFKEEDNWSSLTAFELTAKINDEFGIKLRGIQIRKCTTIKDLYELINNM